MRQGDGGDGVWGVRRRGCRSSRRGPRWLREAGLSVSTKENACFESVGREVQGPSEWLERCAYCVPLLFVCVPVGGSRKVPDVCGSCKRRTSLDSFKILKVIGKGSFGKVFLVREKNAGKIYAMKVS